MYDTKGIRKRNGQIVRTSSWFERVGIIRKKKVGCTEAEYVSYEWLKF